MPPALNTPLLDTAATLIGYVGATLIAAAYFLNQRGRLASNDWRFPAINLLGSAAVILSLIAHPNLPSIVIEIFWSTISLYGIQRNLRHPPP